MKLSEHPDYEQAILRAAFIEKDYYVSEALRALAQVAGDIE